MIDKNNFHRVNQILAMGLMAALLICTAAPADGGKARNVIVLIADGCSDEQYTFARWYKGEPLSLDEIRVGAIKTYVANSVVADSAPAATAFATGYRTSDRLIGVGPKGDTLSNVEKPSEEMQYKPLATVLEGARLMSKSTGIVVTSRVTHATPAGYMAHVQARSMENDIMEQAVYQNIDLVFGGGMQHLLPESEEGKRTDGENLIRVLKDHGYQIVQTRDEMMQIHSGKVFGMFASSHMAAEIDRSEFSPEQPALDEMTRKAVELLSQDPDGFFLMIEGSQIDWACHANDPAHLLSDLLMYDKAVEIALDFAKKDGNTLVLALSDHNTGGFSIGNYSTSKTCSQMKLEAFLDPFRKMKLSAPGLWKKVGNEKTVEKVKSVVRDYWGLSITNEEAGQILAVAERDKASPHNGFGEVLSPRHTFVGWTTHGHCGGDVPLHAFGPGRPTGLLDGPDIGKITAAALGIDLADLNARLFVEAGKAFQNGKVVMDETDENNPVLKVEFSGKIAELPVNKNILKLGETATELEGVTVYIAETGKCYLPMQAVQLIKGEIASLPGVPYYLSRFRAIPLNIPEKPY